MSDEGIGSGSVLVEEVSEQGSVPDLLGGEQGRCPGALHRGGGTGRGQAESSSEYLVAGRRQEQDQDPGQLRGSGPVGLSIPALRLQRKPFPVEAAVRTQVIGEPLAGGQDGPSFRPGQGLGGSRTTADRIGRFFGNQCDGPTPSRPTRSGWTSFARTFSTWKVLRGWPWRLARGSWPWTSSTSPPLARRYGTGSCRATFSRRPGGQIGGRPGRDRRRGAVGAGGQRSHMAAGRSRWRRVREFRAQQGEEVHASALTFHESPVHVSVVVAG